MKSKLLFFLIVALSITALVFNSYATEPKMGGVLNAVIDTYPSTLDSVVGPTTVNSILASHMFETLLTFDDNLKIIPMLVADLPKISDDKLTYTFKLRSGVKFHNGKELTTEDVVASINRWFKLNSNGRNLLKYVDSIEVIDSLTFDLKLTRPLAVALTYIARFTGGAYIYPKELCEKYPDKALEEFIGTGPYKFVDWKTQQYIKMVRYDDYMPVDFPATGFGGKKVAYLDEITWYPIDDPAVRLNGVEGGEYDFSDFISTDEYDRLKDDPDIQTYPSAFRGSQVIYFNKRVGVFTDVKIRQAALAALDMQPILQVARGNEKFWRTDPSMVLKSSMWWSDTGKEMYDQNDPEKAKMLLKEAGYKGEKIRMMSTIENSPFSLVVKQQLEKAGFKIDLQIMDFATLTARRKNPELWEIFSSGMTWKADPSMLTIMNPGYPGWWENPKFLELLDKFSTELDLDKRYKLMEEIQELYYTDVPSIKTGNYRNLRILKKEFKGFANFNEPFFWNVWKEQ